MHSIPYAMTWEMLRRGRWQMLLAVLGANLLTLLLLTALKVDGALDPNDTGLITMQMILIQFQPVFFAAAIFSSIEFTPRSYTLPVPTTTLVAWKMFPAMALMLIESVVSTVAMNWLFQLQWPIWGPALLATVSVAAILAAFWYAERSIFPPFTVSLAAVVISLWYKSRWGPLFSFPTHVWSHVSVLDVATLVLFVVVSYFVAVRGVSRSRRGEILGTDGSLVWVDRLMNWSFDFRGDKVVRFPTPLAAHYWSEWVKKGWIMPSAVSACLLFGLTVWTLFSRDPSALMEAIIVGGGMLSGMGMLGGIIIGNLGPNDTNYDMGSFVGTRPLTDRELSAVTMKVTATSALYCWLIWATVFAGICGIQWLSGSLGSSLMFQKLSWWYLPMTLLGSWIANSAVASLTLTGRGSMWVKIACVVFAVYIATLLASKLMDHQSRELLIGMLMVLSGVAAGAISIKLVMAAHRNSIVSNSGVILAAGIWAAMTAVILAETFRTHVPVSAAIVLIGIASLAISPLAAAPLAVTWNRHR